MLRMVAFLVVFYPAIVVGVALGLVLGALVPMKGSLGISAAHAALHVYQVEAEPGVPPSPFTTQTVPVAVRAIPIERDAPTASTAFVAPQVAVLAIASWYGPGFYGNRTACGQILTPELPGVAHRTLPCGTIVDINYMGRDAAVPVIDRGPYVAGRELDMTAATRVLLGCPDLCIVMFAVP